MKLALCQMRCTEALEDNLQRSLAWLATAAQGGAELVLFPEIHLAPFFPQYPGGDVGRYAVTLDSPVVEAFRAACREHHVMAAPNVYLSQGGGRYDASLLIGPAGEVLGIQKMVHIAQAVQFYEQSYYTPSDDGFHVFETPLGNIGLVICFDRHYPESIRTEALMGADLILIPTANVKAEPAELFRWEIRVQAFQNTVPIAMCNRVGLEGEMDFSGESLVIGANGELLALAGDEETILYAEVDMTQARKTGAQKPYKHLRRPELYR